MSAGPSVPPAEPDSWPVVGASAASAEEWLRNVVNDPGITAFMAEVAELRLRDRVHRESIAGMASTLERLRAERDGLYATVSRLRTSYERLIGDHRDQRDDLIDIAKQRDEALAEVSRLRSVLAEAGGGDQAVEETFQRAKAAVLYGVQGTCSLDADGVTQDEALEYAAEFIRAYDAARSSGVAPTEEG